MKSSRWVSILLFLLTLFLYVQTGAFSFVNLDDPEFVTANPFVVQGLTAESVKWALTTQMQYWQPLVFLSHQAVVSLFGMNPAAHHLVNALLHAINAALFFLVLGRLRFPVWAGALSAMFFAWHPLRAESVAWVSERKDVLVGLFWFATILAYIDWVEHGRAARRYVWVVVLFALSLMAKPVAVTLPVVLLILDWTWLNRRAEPLAALIREKLPLAALSAVSVALALAGQSSQRAIDANIGLGDRIINAIRSYAIYLVQTVWPESLTAFYTYKESWPAIEIVGSVALLAAIGWGAWKSWRRSPWWAAALLTYFIILLPNCGLVQVGAQSHADRYTYLPSTFLVAGVCFGVNRWLEGSRDSQRWAVIAGLAAAGILYIAAAVQISYWKDDATLYTRMVQVDPRSPLGHNGVGVVLERMGKLPQALEQYELASAINPGYAEGRANAAAMNLRLGNAAKALPHAQAALQLVPGRQDLYLYLGQALIGTNRLDEAQTALQKGVGLAPGDPAAAELYMQLGVIEYVRKNDNGALAAFQSAVRVNPNFFPARKNLGIVLGNLGRNAEAVAELETYALANPSDTAIRPVIDALRAAK